MKNNNKWSIEEEQQLANIVLSCMQNKKKLIEALREAEKEIPNRTFSACQTKWTDKVKFEYAEQIKEIKEKINAEKDIELKKHEMRKEKNKQENINKRKEKKFKSKEKNKTKKEVKIEKKKGRINTWSLEEDTILANSVLSYLQYRNSASQGIVVASRKLPNRSLEACKARWNTALRHEYRQQVSNIKAIKSKQWTGKEDSILLRGLEENSRNRVSFEQAIRYVNAELIKLGYDRSLSACKARWATIKYDYPYIMY
ncbi:gp379 [Bacillus phage G]|uniref:Gp379 n=1 Tax=Bacillus phage G TaxID=2884420 RepID=G3MAC0_9CAUD|nr:gp379 [Bacillus phage G]AEO93638.1 gp379 [Bacillus phage G]